MPNQEFTLPDLPMQYEDRLVCFIDILGFKEATKEAQDNPRVLTALYDALSELEGSNLVSHLHESVPVLTGDRNFTNALDAGLITEIQKTWPLVATQFSDSFVISCSTSNTGSSLLLIRAIDFLQNIFFKHLGMLMRGGISKGPLIHRQGGPLFGPAMNEAYVLESKKAIYPRIVFSSDASIYLKKLWGEGSSPFFTAFDGHIAMDLVSCLAFKAHENSENWSNFTVQLEEIEQDVRNKSQEALHKVFYLQDRLRQYFSMDL